MTRFLLIRHGANDMLKSDILSGRAAGVHLNAEGRRQASDLADRLSEFPIKAVYSSPLERTRETAEFIARKLEKTVHLAPAANEIDFGSWTGRTHRELAHDPQWRAYNAFRSVVRIPSGEIILEVQVRMIGVLEELCSRHPDEMIALVSHGDPIRTVIAYCLDMPLGDILRFEISPASVSIVDFSTSQAPRVLCVNHSGAHLPL